MRRVLILLCLLMPAVAWAGQSNKQIGRRATGIETPVDNAPVISVTDPVGGSAGVSSAVLAFGGVVADEDLGTLTMACTNDRGGACTINRTAGAWTGTATGQSGVNIITITAQDSAMQSAVPKTATFTYTVPPDSTPPVATITTNGGANFATVSDIQSLAATCTDNVVCVSASYTVNGGAPVACTGNLSPTVSCNSIALAMGGNTIVLTVSDGTNTHQDSITITRTDPGSCTIALTVTYNGSTNPATLTTNDLDWAGTVEASCGIDEVRCGTDSYTDTWAYALKQNVRPLQGKNTVPQYTTAATPFNNNNRHLKQGTNTYACWALDTQGNTQRSNLLEITYNRAIGIITQYVSRGDTGVAYSEQIVPDGGNHTYTWDNQAGGSSLGAGACSGLSITNTAVGGVNYGLISGTPTTAGTCSAAVRVCDSAPTCSSASLSLVVEATLPNYYDHFNTLNALGTKLWGYRMNSNADMAAGNQVPPFTDDFGRAWVVGADYTQANWLQTPTTNPVTGENVGGDSWTKQLKFPVDKTTGSVIWQWDVYYDASWLPYHCLPGKRNTFYAPSLAHKEYQHRMSVAGGGDNDIYAEPRIIYTNEDVCDHIGVHDIRAYSDTAGIPTGVVTGAPLTPTGLGADLAQSHKIYPNEWCTWTTEMALATPAASFTQWNTHTGLTLAAGNYHMYSQWVFCEHDTAPQTIYFRVPLRIRAGEEEFDNANVEWNTSTQPGATTDGPMTRLRNFIALYNYVWSDSTTPTNDTTIFQRPVN